ncbi:hypothetical protein POSPLADRAFT_1142511, partial [Postia placenta MAD-698-R-SB12]
RVFAEWSKQYIGGTTFWSAFTFRNGAETADAAVFRNLSRFAWVMHLALDDVTFPSIVTFGALVSALPGLKELQLCDVKFAESSFLFDSRTLSRFRLLPQAKNLKEIRLGAIVTDRRFRPAFTLTAWSCYTELLDFMAAVSRPCNSSPCVYPWGSVGRLQLEESIWWRFSFFSIARLLRALPSLASLTLRCAEDRLKPVDIVVECGTSQSQHVADINHKDPRRYIFFSRETDTVVTATNELVKHAAPSLEHLHLCLRFRTADLLGHYPYLRYPKDRCEHPTVNLRCQVFRIQLDTPSGRESSTNLGLISSIPDPKVFWIGACKMLSHVTSTCISSVDICIHWFSWIDRGELSDILCQLDTVLSSPVFDNLVHVRIRVELDEPYVHQKKMKEWAYSMKACLPDLDKREIIGIEVFADLPMPDVRVGLIWDCDIKDWRRCVRKEAKRRNVEIAEVPAFEGGAPSGAIAAHTGRERSSQLEDDQQMILE